MSNQSGKKPIDIWIIALPIGFILATLGRLGALMNNQIVNDSDEAK